MDEFEHALEAFKEATEKPITIKVTEDINSYSIPDLYNSTWDIHYINSSSDKRSVNSHSRFKFAFNYHKKYS